MYNSPPKAYASLARAKAQLEAAADHPFRVCGRRKPAVSFVNRGSESHVVVADCRRRKRNACPPTTAPIRGKKRKAAIVKRVQRRKQPNLSERRQVDQSWQPPVSPYGLIQESLWREPWKLLVACMLLNKTSGSAVSAPYLCTFCYIGTDPASRYSRVSNIISSLFRVVATFVSDFFHMLPTWSPYMKGLVVPL